FWLVAGCRSLPPRPATSGREPIEDKSATVHTNTAALAGTWHSVIVTPRPGLPKIHTYNKLNPVWWFKNLDDPVPPDWYRPNEKHRVALWYCRNPFHNFDFYVIGINDKPSVRSGRYPELDSNPHGGWDFAVSRRKLVLLPFISYQRGRFNFYFGWREHGSFGLKLNRSGPTADQRPK